MYRKLVLDAAERVFARAGYENAKVTEIAAEAGIAPATLYNTFPRKWEIFRAVHARRGRELMARALATVDLEGPVVDAMLAGVEGYLRFHLEHPHYLRMHLQDGSAWAVAPHLRTEEQEALWEEGVALTASFFRRGVEEGAFVADDPEVMARTMIAMHQVRLSHWVAQGSRAEEVEALVAAARAQLLRAFCPPQVAVALLARERLS